MEDLKIAIDLDGVLADASKIWIRLLNEKFNIVVTKSDVNKWDFWKKINISKQAFENTLNEAWEEWSTVEETEINLCQKVRTIRNLGKTNLVTARNEKTMNNVMKWLRKNKIEFDNIIVVDEFYSKAKLDYDVFIDDSPIQIMEIANSKKLALIYNQPWNSNVKERNNLIRINNFFEAEKIIEKYKQKI